MRLLIYGINYSPELTGVGKYTGEMAEWFRENGWEVEVVTAPPYYPHWEVSKGYSRWRQKSETLNGVLVHRVPLFVPRNPRFLNRLLHLASFAILSFPRLLRASASFRPDLLLVVQPTLFCAPGALFASRLFRTQTWVHVQDFEVGAAFGSRVARLPWLRPYAEAIESWLLRRFDHASAITSKMVDRLEAYGVPPERSFCFPNWVQSVSPSTEEQLQNLRKRLAIDPVKKVILYSGNLGEKQGLEIVVETARILKDRQDTLFVICGEGLAKRRLKESSASLDNVHWLNLQPIEDFHHLLNLADLHLLPQKLGIGDLVFPSKILAMLGSGKPIVTTAAPGTRIFELVSRFGVVSKPESALDLSQSIDAALENRADLRARAQEGQTYVTENWGTESVLGSVLIRMKSKA